MRRDLKGFKNTSQLGECAEAVVAVAFLRAGFTVLYPRGNSSKYDLVVDTGRGFLKIQVKSSHLGQGIVRFKLFSEARHGKELYTKEDVDFFVVCSLELDKLFVFPVGCKLTQLRVEEPKNGQRTGINWCHEYEFDKWVRSLGASSKMHRARKKV